MLKRSSHSRSQHLKIQNCTSLAGLDTASQELGAENFARIADIVRNVYSVFHSSSSLPSFSEGDLLETLRACEDFYSNDYLDTVSVSSTTRLLCASFGLGFPCLDHSHAESILFASFAPPTPGSKFNVRSTALPNLNVMAVSDPVKPGWALSAWSKPIQRKRQKVVKWLTDLFESGEKSGRKTKPGAAQALMKTLRNDQNALAFTVEERLSKSQIQSWFSAYARERKARMAVLHAIEQTDTNASNKGKNS